MIAAKLIPGGDLSIAWIVERASPAEFARLDNYRAHASSRKRL